MIQKFYLILLLPLLVWGCGKDSTTDEGPQQTLTLSLEEVNPSPTGVTKPVMVTSTGEWTSEIVPASAASWLSLVPAGGGEGNTLAQVVAGAIGEGATRTAAVKISAGKQSRTITVNQEKAYLTDDWTGGTMSFSMEEESKTFNVSTNVGNWSAVCMKDDKVVNWCTVSKGIGTLTVTTLMNTPGGDARTATLKITAGTLTREIPINQAAFNEDGSYYTDKNVVQLQAHTVGNGVKVVLMGDGYTITSMKKGTGKYETDMRTGMSHFFSTYPISEFRNYFDVWMVTAVSTEEGLSVETPAKTVNTAFSCLWEGSQSTGISCDESAVFTYLRAIPEFSSYNNNQMPAHPITVIMPINANVYAGTCMMWYPENYMSIGMIPVNTRTDNYSFKSTLVHESCGHGFGKLIDEYIYYPQQTIPASDQNSLASAKRSYNCLENIDFSSDISQTTWAGFAADRTKYPVSVVNTFEGARFYGKGIWRPESNSCMNNNVLYFNAPSRYAQVRRIMKHSGVNTNYTVAEFMAWDTPPNYASVATATSTRAPELPFVPLAPPIIMPIE